MPEIITFEECHFNQTQKKNKTSHGLEMINSVRTATTTIVIIEPIL